MRLFVAVVPPEPALAGLRALADELRPHYRGLGWVAPERWHVTLVFLGDVTEAQVGRLEGQLAFAATQHRPIELAVAGGGCFPNVRRPQVFWAGLSGAVDALELLARDTAAAARYARIALDRKPFRAHVTLARVRRAPFTEGPELVDRLSSAYGDPWAVGEIVLTRSHLGPRPEYERVAAWPLTGG